MALATVDRFENFTNDIQFGSVAWAKKGAGNTYLIRRGRRFGPCRFAARLARSQVVRHAQADLSVGRDHDHSVEAIGFDDSLHVMDQRFPQRFTMGPFAHPAGQAGNEAGVFQQHPHIPLPLVDPLSGQC